MFAAIWNNRLRKAPTLARAAGGVFCAFNANIDAIEYMDRTKLVELLNRFDVQEMKLIYENPPVFLDSSMEVFAGIIGAMRKGKALQWQTSSMPLLTELSRLFEGADEQRMGGQSGIIANLLASLNLKVLVFLPILARIQARQFHWKCKFPINENGKMILLPPKEASRPDDEVKQNWIFEYSKGMKIPFGSEIISPPRTNRFILASRPKMLKPVFSKEIRQILPEIGMEVQRAVMSGYQYLKAEYPDGMTCDDYLKKGAEDLDSLRSKNSLLRIHFEFASIRSEIVREQAMKYIAPAVDSLGINEIETVDVLNVLGETELARAIEREEGFKAGPYHLFEGVQFLFEKYKLPRIHVHNLGYYLVLLRKDYHPHVTPDSVRNACLMASVAATAKTLAGEWTTKRIREYEFEIGKKIAISFRGLDNMQKFAFRFNRDAEGIDREDFMSTGFIERDNHWIIFVPAQMTPTADVKSTVGLGDTISSTSFVFDYDITKQRNCP